MPGIARRNTGKEERKDSVCRNSIRNIIVLHGICVLFRVGGVNPVNVFGQQNGVGIDLRCPQHRSRIGREEGISGPAAEDDHPGLDFDVIGQVAQVIKKCVEAGVQVGVVVGGGNFWRGLKDGGDRMERSRADHMGMLATAINLRRPPGPLR